MRVYRLQIHDLHTVYAANPLISVGRLPDALFAHCACVCIYMLTSPPLEGAAG